MAGWNSKDIFAKAVEYYDKFEFDLAEKFLLKVLEQDTSHYEALAMYGSVCLEKGNADEAEKVYKRIIENHPTECTDAHMALAELYCGLEAINQYQLGINLIQQELSACNDENERKSLARKISTAICAIAEIYMTDCCYEPDAEEKLESLIKQAFQCDPANPEVYQVAANFRMSQDKAEEAKEVFMKGYQLWKDLDAIEESCPSYHFRLNAARLFIEMNNYENAIDVLEKLIKENDEDIEVWYLFGLTYYLDEQFLFSAECLTVADQLYEKLQYNEPSLIEDIKQMLKDIESKGITEEDEMEISE